MPPGLFDIVTKEPLRLRPYQEECIEAVSSALQNHQSSLIVMATGLGKTVTAAEILNRRGGRSMWVAHRSELIEQAQDTISKLIGAVPQIEMADQEAHVGFGGSECIIASVQTLNANRKGSKRMTKFDPSYYSTLITDEAHHAVANSWKAVANHFTQNPELKHVGMTATPDRGDQVALGKLYDTCAFKYDIQDGVGDGWLVPLLIQRIYIDEINLTEVGSVAGDLNQGELAHVMEKEKVVFGLADAILSEAGDKKTLVFTSSVKHAHALADILNSRKPGLAAGIDGKTPKDERKDLINRFRSGDLQYLCNVGIATEGFDVPNIECVAIARPTKSRALYTQMVGRGTRPLPGIVDGIVGTDGRRQSIFESLKPNTLILDFVGNSGRHKLVSAADVLGGNYSDVVVKEANRMATHEGVAVDTIELLKRAEAIVAARMQKQKESNMRRKVKTETSYRKVANDPFNILDIEPELTDNEWNNVTPLSYKQQQWLERSGIMLETLSVPEQRKVLNQMINRKVKGLATPKQCKCLKRYGYRTQHMKKDEASRLIDELANNNWRKPK